MQNAITEANGSYHVISRFPRKHVAMAIPLKDNPDLLIPGMYARCIEQIKLFYPRITQMDATIEETPDFGKVLVIHVKGW